MVEVEVVKLFTVNTRVARLSQSPLVLRVAVWDSAFVKVSPFQLYGSLAEQILRLVVEVMGGAIVRFSVAKLSQPPLVFRVAVWVPAALKVNPFQLYGSFAEQILRLIAEVMGGAIVRFSVARLSQPTLLVRAAV
jgi:hypothetical protein